MGKFKTSTLRNIAITNPYMHDKRFTTLDDVIEHYSSGIQASGTLDPIIDGWGGTGLNFTEQEKTDLIAFLNTLTDNDMMTDSSLSSPIDREQIARIAQDVTFRVSVLLLLLHPLRSG